VFFGKSEKITLTRTAFGRIIVMFVSSNTLQHAITFSRFSMPVNYIKKCIFELSGKFIFWVFGRAGGAG